MFVRPICTLLLLTNLIKYAKVAILYHLVSQIFVSRKDEDQIILFYWKFRTDRVFAWCVTQGRDCCCCNTFDTPSKWFVGSAKQYCEAIPLHVSARSCISGERGRYKLPSHGKAGQSGCSAGEHRHGTRAVCVDAAVGRFPELSKQGGQQLNQDRRVYRSVMRQVARCRCCCCLRVASMMTELTEQSSTSSWLHHYIHIGTTSSSSSAGACLFIFFSSTKLYISGILTPVINNRMK